jgi:hypothetical protein
MPYFLREKQQISSEQLSENKDLRLVIYDAGFPTREDVDEGKRKLIEAGKYKMMKWRIFLNSNNLRTIKYNFLNYSLITSSLALSTMYAALFLQPYFIFKLVGGLYGPAMFIGNLIEMHFRSRCIERIYLRLP